MEEMTSPRKLEFQMVAFSQSDSRHAVGHACNRSRHNVANEESVEDGNNCMRERQESVIASNSRRREASSSCSTI